MCEHYNIVALSSIWIHAYPGTLEPYRCVRGWLHHYNIITYHCYIPNIKHTPVRYNTLIPAQYPCIGAARLYINVHTDLSPSYRKLSICFIPVIAHSQVVRTLACCLCIMGQQDSVEQCWVCCLVKATHAHMHVCHRVMARVRCGITALTCWYFMSNSLWGFFMEQSSPLMHVCWIWAAICACSLLFRMFRSLTYWMRSSSAHTVRLVTIRRRLSWRTSFGVSRVLGGCLCV